MPKEIRTQRHLVILLWLHSFRRWFERKRQSKWQKKTLNLQRLVLTKRVAVKLGKRVEMLQKATFWEKHVSNQKNSALQTHLVGLKNRLGIPVLFSMSSIVFTTSAGVLLFIGTPQAYRVKLSITTTQNLNPSFYFAFFLSKSIKSFKWQAANLPNPTW